PLLAEAGVHVLLPSEGKIARVGISLRGSESGWKSGAAVTRFGLQTLVDFDWKIAIGDTLLTPAEFEELASQKIPLVSVRGQWVLLDPASVERTLKLFDRRPGGRTTLGDFLRIAGGLEAENGSYPIDSIEGEGWLGDLMEGTSARREIAAFKAPVTLQGTLRPYQERGVAWLRFLTSRGLGACLADDMGLGKTVQFLATLLSAQEAGEPIRPALLVCPTSVAENWLKEGARFAPSLKIAIHHGPDRASGEAFTSLIEDVDLIVTTYALTHRDRALLSEVSWEYLALDEAQNVKNPAAAQSRAVRSLKARRRATLTGTPVENHLAELKSIFDFLNPGLLGTDEEFRREFALPIERQREPAAAERLRRVTAPFLLRRAKTDEGVAPDLPAKIETKESVGLTREQATLYRAATRSLLDGIGRASARSRRTKVLLLLLRLKQICNHPVHFLGDGTRLENRSGKLIRLMEMLEETLAEKRPALIFTQFTQMGHLLVSALKARFGCEVLFLHGGIPRQARAEMVRAFQEDDEPPPLFVLSLKAGGSGLNLTRASHVFHYDRWWNPAVEDQATDRAFRIGQTRNVQVHKFVCHGTLEERIDRMIEEKKDLAQNIIGTGESWIADMSDAQLAELVALSKDAVELEGRR
ncbi:MAG: DEAD/DEAH box helicase, partial [Thermoanaerobaculia bacterium]